MRPFETRAQRYVYRAVWVAVLLSCLYLAGLQVHATITCAPQAGKWTPLTGKVCYGE